MGHRRTTSAIAIGDETQGVIVPAGGMVLQYKLL